MASTFSGFNIARSGLSSSQLLLNTVSHNIANANTEGYSRQRITTTAYEPDTFPSAPGTIGTGVGVNNTQQIRDEFLDFKFRGEVSKQGEFAALANTYKTLEAIINEPSDSGITTIMDEFFSSMHELNKNPESLTTRALVRQRGIALTEAVKGMSASFKKEQENLDFEVTVVASQVNGFARQIADLNRGIYLSELNGAKANDLRDQRNLLVDKLSELVDLNYYEDSMGRFYVDVNGGALVSHYDYDELEPVERVVRNNPDDINKLKSLEWKSGSTFSAQSGKLNALINMRDKISGSPKGIPYYVDKLNEFVDTIATELNRVHKSGYDLNGDTGTNMFTINNMSTADYENEMLISGFNGTPAIDVTSATIAGTDPSFTEEDNNTIIRANINSILANNPDYAGKSVKYIQGKYLVVDRITAEEITVSSDLEFDLDKISASATAEGAPGDGDNALNLAQVRHNVGLYAWGSPDDFIKSLVSNLGVDAQEAIRNEANEEVILNQIEYNRQSVMGVSLDEEMSNMVMYQHSYNAAARIMSTLDTLIETIINLGR